jgi:Kef-type K+ transport system membrane component KefB
MFFGKEDVGSVEPTYELVMKKVIIFSLLLACGFITAQWLPGWAGDSHELVAEVVHLLGMATLAFIMIHVGLEFQIVKAKWRSYGWDFFVAMSAATLPWIFVALYFLLVMLPAGAWHSAEAWKGSFLAGLFSAPTSAGVLLAMLSAAGLGATWMFGKARILAIFDDLGVLLLLIPLKIMLIGPAWQLGVVVALMLLLLWAAWRFLHRLTLSTHWPEVLAYSVGITLASEGLYLASRAIDPATPVQLEVLLPAFVLGCIIHRPPRSHEPAPVGYPVDLAKRAERTAFTIICGTFMLLVGLSMPPVVGAALPEAALNWPLVALHVILLTILCNLGKMFPALCYRREATVRERLSLAVGMWPRGEVGAGVLVISLAYHVPQEIITAALLSLALNLVLTGVFIVIIKRLNNKPLSLPGRGPAARRG